jgi:hypothetical protein
MLKSRRSSKLVTQGNDFGGLDLDIYKDHGFEILYIVCWIS